jgi:hypothetical protein
MLNAQAAGAASCDTVTVWPAMVRVDIRAEPAFAPALNTTSPSPVPDPPVASVRNELPAVAVQAQDVPCVIVT